MQKLLRQAHVVSTFAELNIRIKGRTPPKVLGNWLATRFQVLGPTYIKIGQFISSRADIFGEEFTEQFFELRDQVVPIPQAQATEIIKELESRHGFIQNVEVVPLASASIGQVHKGVDVKGKDLLVKIKRPNIRSTIENDIEFLRYLFNFATNVGIENVNNTLTILNEFEAFLFQEVSFRKEYENLVKFYNTYMPGYGQSLLCVPRVVKGACDDDCIVMEYIHNKGFDAYEGNRSELAKQIMLFFVRQLVQYGILHGDPHKGNIGITKDNRVVLYDYGNIITITEDERNLLKELICMLILGNKYGVVKILEKLGVQITDKEIVLTYIEKYIDYMRTLDIKVFANLQTGNDKLPIHLSGKIIRILRVYGVLEGICKELDPEFNYFKLVDERAADLMFDMSFVDYKVKKDMSALTRLQDVVYKLSDI